jgi:hypothetical protein
MNQRNRETSEWRARLVITVQNKNETDWRVLCNRENKTKSYAVINTNLWCEHLPVQIEEVII